MFIEGGALPSLAALLNYSPERPLRGIAKDTFAALGQRWYLFEIDEDDEDMNQESIVSSLSTASGPHLPVTEGVHPWPSWMARH